MPKELLRYQHTGHFHFVTFSCFHRQPFLASPESRDLFERSLETMRVRYDFVVAGYVLMPEHVHLLLSEPKKAALSKALQAVKRGLVSEPADWAWSSFRHYAAGEQRAIEVESDWTAAKRHRATT